MHHQLALYPAAQTVERPAAHPPGKGACVRCLHDLRPKRRENIDVNKLHVLHLERRVRFHRVIKGIEPDVLLNFDTEVKTRSRLLR